MHKKLTKSLSIISSSLKSIELKKLPKNKYNTIAELSDLESMLKYKINDLKALKNYYSEEIEELKEVLAIHALKMRGETLTDTFSVDDKKDCFCNLNKDVDLIACDNPGCTIGWYHLDCVGLKEIPEDEWICDDCIIKKQ